MSLVISKNDSTASAPDTLRDPEGSADYLNIVSLVEYARARGITAATKTWVRTLISNSTLPFVKCGRAFYVSRRSFDAYLQQHERRKR